MTRSASPPGASGGVRGATGLGAVVRCTSMRLSKAVRPGSVHSITRSIGWSVDWYADDEVMSVNEEYSTPSVIVAASTEYGEMLPTLSRATARI